jgi:hypothetical protein
VSNEKSKAGRTQEGAHTPSWARICRCHRAVKIGGLVRTIVWACGGRGGGMRTRNCLSGSLRRSWEGGIVVRDRVGDRSWRRGKTCGWLVGGLELGE